MKLSSVLSFLLLVAFVTAKDPRRLKKKKQPPIRDDFEFCEDIERERRCNDEVGCMWMMGECMPNCGIFVREGPCSRSDGCMWFRRRCIPMPDCDMFLRQGPCEEAGCSWSRGECDDDDD